MVPLRLPVASCRKRVPAQLWRLQALQGHLILLGAAELVSLERVLHGTTMSQLQPPFPLPPPPEAPYSILFIEGIEGRSTAGAVGLKPAERECGAEGQAAIGPQACPVSLSETLGSENTPGTPRRRE
ncbi:hypothetical protein MATL_G00235620 [Megalops atlanticus]|uniref:Uncharacterized protein n=1 Tax=Megalops atlanticus TaxID=7932 RepID=A0A9D3PIT9_MEGAT|nr:hypothetical protein MATL_G00235620 [Megalops atlanticus]